MYIKNTRIDKRDNVWKLYLVSFQKLALARAQCIFLLFVNRLRQMKCGQMIKQEE